MHNLLMSMNELSDLIVATFSSLGVWYIVLYNFFGVCATVTKGIEFQIKKRDNILVFAIIASCCWLMYFLVQGDFVSALGNFFALTQIIVFKQRGKHKWADSIFWLFFFMITQLTLNIISFKVIYDIFPICGGILGNIMYFVMKEKHYRYIGLFAMMLWLCNSISKGYLLAMINDSIAVVSIIVAIIRYGRMEKKEKLAQDGVDQKAPLQEDFEQATSKAE